ncbi:DUF3097 family protein [Arcanobacterium hippocoleae]
MRKDYSNRHPSGRPIHDSRRNYGAPQPLYAHPNDRYALNEIELPANYRNAPREIPVQRGMVLEDVSSGYVGEVMSVRKIAGQWQMELEDGDFKRRSFPLGAGFWLAGKAVYLLPPVAAAQHNAPAGGKN